MNRLDAEQRIRDLAQVAALPAELDAWPAVNARLHRARRRRFAFRLTLGAAAGLGAAAAVTAVVLIARAGSQPVNAAAIVRRAAAVLRAGTGLPPVALTVVTTTAAGYGPAAPPRVVERIGFAAPNRWRDAAAITRPGDRGTQHVTAIRNGGHLATVGAGKVSVESVSGQGGSLFGASAVGQRLAWTSVLAAMGTGRCAPSLAVDRNGPLIDGRPTLALQVEAARCPSEAAPETGGPATFWLDARTYLVLRAELHGPAGQLAQTVRVTALRYRPGFQPGTFTLPAPAPGARAPQGGTVPTVGALRAALAYRPLLPRRLPDGLRVSAIAAIANGGAPAAGGKLTEFTITYSNPSGQPVVQLYEAPAASPSARFTGRPERIRPGVTGTVTTIEGVILWWVQHGRYCSLQTGGVTAGLQLGTVSKKELAQMAATFS